MITNDTTLKPAIVSALTLCLVTIIWAGNARAKHSASLSGYGTMHVVKTPTCGCCGAWVPSARAEGFEVEVPHTADVTSAKLQGGIPVDMWTCHTAPTAVPGMPYGSPGIGADPNARYDVFRFGGEAFEDQVFYSVGQCA